MLPEAALATVVFSLFIFSIFDFGRIYYVRARLHNAVSQAARYATIGNTLEDLDNPGQQLSRYDSIVATIERYAGMTLAPTDVEITAVSGDGQPVIGAGGPGDVVTVAATHRITIVTPFLSSLFQNNEYEFRATASFRNEEFSGA